MRIAILSWEALHAPCVGGVGRHVSELAAALAARGHDIHLITRMADGQSYHELIDGVHYHRCPYAGSSDFVDDVNNMCRAFVERVFVIEDMTAPFDVIHAHDWLAANAMIWIKQQRSRPAVFTTHSTEYGRCGNAFPHGRSERIRYQERAGTYWADRVICVSNTLRAELAWMYEVPETKMNVIPNGVEPARFQAPVDLVAMRRRYDLDPVDPVVVFSGRLEWQKGPDFLLEAMPTVLRSHPDAKLVFVGDGSMRAGLEHRAWELGIGASVRFLGRRSQAEIASVYRVGDVVCLPSRNEPFGIVILEAWCAGRPVIVTEHGGAAEIVRHERDGLHVAPTPESIAAGIDALFSDRESARRMGEAGRSQAITRYSWSAIAEKTAAVYERVAPEAALRERVAAQAAVAATVPPRTAKRSIRTPAEKAAEGAPEQAQSRKAPFTRTPDPAPVPV